MPSIKSIQFLNQNLLSEFIYLVRRKKSRLQKVMHYIPKIAMILRVDENLVDLVDITDAPFPIAFAAISGRLIYTKNNIERINFEVKTMAAMQTDGYYIKRDYKFARAKIAS